MANEFAPRKNDAAVSPAAKSLPAAAGTENTASIDLNAVAPFLPGNVEFELTTPTLAVGALPNGETVTYELEDSADDTTFADVYILDEALQTGAGGAGATGATIRFNVPSNVGRYVRVSATTSGGSGDCSASSMTLKLRIAP